MRTPDVDGPRECTKGDLAGVIALVDGEMRAGSSQSMLTDYPLVYADANLGNVRIMKAGGEVVSVVPFIERKVEAGGCRFSVGIISPTATAASHRRKGYGLACLRSCVERMTRAGIDLSVLWTEVRTFPFYEHAAYQAVRYQGWVYACRREDAGIFRRGDAEAVRYDAETREHIEAIQAMHERDVHGVIREGEAYPVLFSLPGMETLVALRDGAAVGYLVVSRGINKPGLLEAGGEADAVEVLVHRALSELEEGVLLKAHGNLTPSVLGDVMEARMPERREPGAGGNMMIRINDARGFMGKISDWLVERNGGKARAFSIGITDTGEVISFAFGEGALELGGEVFEGHLEMTLAELTGVVFGAHAERPVAVPEDLKDLFPFCFPLFMLDHS